MKSINLLHITILKELKTAKCACFAYIKIYSFRLFFTLFLSTIFYIYIFLLPQFPKETEYEQSALYSSLESKQGCVEMSFLTFDYRLELTMAVNIFVTLLTTIADTILS